jgi:hypothetical protein
MRSWVDRVLQTESSVHQEGRNGTYGVLERADVVSAVWTDDWETPVVRVIRGLSLDGLDPKHGALQFKNELGALETAFSHGDEIGLLKDGRTLDVLEPTVPRHLIGLLMSDRVLFYDGTELEFVCPFEVEDA